MVCHTRVGRQTWSEGGEVQQETLRREAAEGSEQRNGILWFIFFNTRFIKA